VESTLNVGTTFIFFIPYKKGEDKLLQPEVKETVNYKDLAGMHVLVAEDVALNQFLIRHILESWGCSLDIVNNGVEALDMVKVKTFDIILMDIHMPEMDGINAISLLRKEYEDVKIIVLTMYDDQEMISKMMEMGANAYLTKTTDPEEIYNAILTCMNDDFYFNDLLNKAVLMKLQQKKTTRQFYPNPVKFTEKEINILKLMIQIQLII
jgi:DNA-binding NarL/FixJ family response regulator